MKGRDVAVCAQAIQSTKLAEAREVFPGGVLATFALPEDISPIVDRGRGARVWDIDGREYVDLVLGSGPMVLGHAHPDVVDAVATQIGRGSQFNFLTDTALRLAQVVVDAVPCADMVKFASSGSEATSFALRLARAFTGREQILQFRGGYHGHHDYSMWGRTAGVPAAIGDLVHYATFNDIEDTLNAIDRHSADLAAVIVEPMIRVVPPQPGFLEALRSITAERGIVLIFDEVVTGFRVAWGGGQERYGVVPDLACYGKIVGGGLPLSAVAGKRDIMMLANPRERAENFVYVSGTLNGNPLAAAAGLATLEVLSADGVYDSLEEKGRTLAEALRAAVSRTASNAQVMNQGPVVGVAFTSESLRDPAAVARSDRQALAHIERELAERGVLANLLVADKMFLSTAHTSEDIRMVGEAFAAGLASMGVTV